MNIYQKSIDKLVKSNIRMMFGTEYMFISYKEHRKAWKEETKGMPLAKILDLKRWVLDKEKQG